MIVGDIHQDFEALLACITCENRDRSFIVVQERELQPAINARKLWRNNRNGLPLNALLAHVVFARF
jgi:hypothetical protein